MLFSGRHLRKKILHLKDLPVLGGVKKAGGVLEGSGGYVLEGRARVLLQFSSFKKKKMPN